MWCPRREIIEDFIVGDAVAGVVGVIPFAKIVAFWKFALRIWVHRHGTVASKRVELVTFVALIGSSCHVALREAFE